MKPTFPRWLMLAAFPFFMSACGGNNDNKDTTTPTTDTAGIAEEVTTPASTIVTSPQFMMVVRHKVADYTKWKPGYDSYDTARLAKGIHNYVIGRGLQDTSMVMLALKIDDVAKAKAFAKDPGLKQAMQKDGVKGTPNIQFHELVYQDTAVLPPSTVRVLSNFTVKDWDTWRKAFESNRQVRTDNGIIDRVYGYNVDDNHKVALVFAFTDTAKANAYRKSDLFKQKRAEAGVIGDPDLFFYRVVQRY